MKYMICVLLTLVSFSLLAVIRTVDNNNPSAGQYTTISAAISAASNDDVIYVYPSLIPYQGFTMNKRVIVYGTGWNENGIALRNVTISGHVYFQAGGENSMISGLYGWFNVIYTNVNNFEIDSCCLSYFGQSSASATDTSFGIVIKDTYFSGNYGTNPYIENSRVTNGINILNCVFNQGTTNSRKILLNASANVTITNSILRSGTERVFATAYSSNGIPTFRNNYIDSAGYSSAGEASVSFPWSSLIMYNIGSGSFFTTGFNNLNSIPIASVFNYPGPDSWTLIEGSTATDSGDPVADYNDLDGSRNDIGVFGGPYPMDTNGLTTLPTITDISGTLYTSPSQGLQIHVEASSRH